MKVTEAKYTRRYVTGDYEFEEMTLTAQVEEESGAEVLTNLKEEVASAHTGEVAPKQPKKQEKKKNGTKSKTRPADDEDANDEDSEVEDAGDDGEGDQDDETPVDQDSDDADDSSDSGEDDEEASDDEQEDEEEAAPAKPAAKKGAGKKSPGKKGGSKKPQNYNRAIEQHKEIFSGVLKSVAPNWKKSEETKLKAKKVSEKMEGKEFLDADGDVLESFTKQVEKLMASKK